jgi:hypothetical protein
MLTLGYIFGGLVAAVLILGGLGWLFISYFGAMMSDNPGESASVLRDMWWGVVPIIIGIVVIVLMVRG